MKIGIDPGNTGALALMYDNGDLIEAVEMPLLQMGTKKQVNAVELSNIIENWKTMARLNEEGLSAAVEKVNAMPQQGVTSTFNFGMGYGTIKGVLAANKIPMDLVTPNAWKKHFALIGKDKDNARTLAQQKYPNQSLAMKKDIGKADAILICLYACEISNLYRKVN